MVTWVTLTQLNYSTLTYWREFTTEYALGYFPNPTNKLGYDNHLRNWRNQNEKYKGISAVPLFTQEVTSSFTQ